METVHRLTEFAIRHLLQQARFRAATRRLDDADHVGEVDVLAAKSVLTGRRDRHLWPLAALAWTIIKQYLQNAAYLRHAQKR